MEKQVFCAASLTSTKVYEATACQETCVKQTTCYFICPENQKNVNECNLNHIQHRKQLSTSQDEVHLRRRNKSTICSTCTAHIAGQTSRHSIDFRHSLKLTSIAHALAHDIVLSCNCELSRKVCVEDHHVKSLDMCF